VKDAAVFLQHIRDSIVRIEAYTAHGRQAFLADSMVQDTVIRNLEVIGEAVKNLPLALWRRHRQIPWRSIESDERGNGRVPHYYHVASHTERA